MHPGDVRKLNAVHNDRLEKFLENRAGGVIFFSTKGQRSDADKMSGGDFDGDTYFVIFNAQIVDALEEVEAYSEVKAQPMAMPVHTAAKAAAQVPMPVTVPVDDDVKISASVRYDHHDCASEATHSLSAQVQPSEPAQQQAVRAVGFCYKDGSGVYMAPAAAVSTSTAPPLLPVTVPRTPVKGSRNEDVHQYQDVANERPPAASFNPSLVYGRPPPLPPMRRLAEELPSCKAPSCKANYALLSTSADQANTPNSKARHHPSHLHPHPHPIGAEVSPARPVTRSIAAAAAAGAGSSGLPCPFPVAMPPDSSGNSFWKTAPPPSFQEIVDDEAVFLSGRNLAADLNDSTSSKMAVHQKKTKANGHSAAQSDKIGAEIFEGDL
jgi:hypothetical protein